MKNLGHFQTYEPEGPNPHKIVFFKNQNEEDWYSLAKKDGVWFVGIQDNKVVCKDGDITMLAPNNMTVLVLDAEDPVPEIGWVFDGDMLSPPEDEGQSVTKADVNAERQRRLEFGCVVTLSTGKAIPIQGRAQDQTNMLGLVTIAQMRIQAGDTTSTTTFRDRDNQDHPLTPAEVIELWQRGAAYFELVMQASWALKDSDPIPPDFADDKHWPNAR